MYVLVNVSTVLIFLGFLIIDSVICNGLFYLQRIPSSCVETTINSTTNNNLTSNCFIFDWQQISNFTTNYTTYINPDTNQAFYVYSGALTVLGTIDNYDLDYYCPPTGYNGVGPGCTVQIDTQLVMLHVNTIDRKIYAIDVILSGTPFPFLSNLTDNQPPFGKARHIFRSGIAMQSTGYFKICKSNTSTQCPFANTNTYKLPNPLPSNTGYGIFGIQAASFVTDAVWIMDDIKQLLIITLGTTYYYFNASGFFIYQYDTNACTWMPSCNYQCEAYNYNSRFLDYSGIWIITNKWGIASTKPVAVKAWIGNAIDAAGVFPIVMYTDNATGHYLGLDKLDTVIGPKMGATYWYLIHDTTVTMTSIATYRPSVVDVNCVSKLSDWAGTMSSCATYFKLNNIQMIITLLILTYICML
ncbi:unnamed protein product [Adineta steineri]|uniref:Uncharacterized protein n=1 Tax=Adineta steineri TaxID=433720 RepID=A0A814TW72_9BILA|nr:unnamed protein product [Adineta steineri]